MATAQYGGTAVGEAAKIYNRPDFKFLNFSPRESYSSAFGYYSTVVDSIYSNAIGSQTNIDSSDYATALGDRSRVNSADYGLALGANSTVNASGSVALGAGSLAKTNANIVGESFDGKVYTVPEELTKLTTINERRLFEQLLTQSENLREAVDSLKYYSLPDDGKDRVRAALEKLNEIKGTNAFVSTFGAVSVGDTDKGILRQITGVAAGKEDTDAVNVAQLKAAQEAAKIHYFSVNATDQTYGSNFDNDGAQVTPHSLAIGEGARTFDRAKYFDLPLDARNKAILENRWAGQYQFEEKWKEGVISFLKAHNLGNKSESELQAMKDYELGAYLKGLSSQFDPELLADHLSKVGALGEHNLALGYNALADGTGSIAIGKGAVATLTGSSSDLYLDDSIAIGTNAFAQKGITIGKDSTSYGGVSIGDNVKVAGTYYTSQQVAIGSNIRTSGIAIGNDIDNTYDDGGISIGNNTSVKAQSIAIGIGAKADTAKGSTRGEVPLQGTSIGAYSEASQDFAVALGAYSRTGDATYVVSTLPHGSWVGDRETERVVLGKNGYDPLTKSVVDTGIDSLPIAPDENGLSTLTDLILRNSETLDEAAKVDFNGDFENANLNAYQYFKKIKELRDAGKLASTSTFGEVSVGDVERGVTRRITSLGAGVEDTDAVNVWQLKRVAEGWAIGNDPAQTATEVGKVAAGERVDFVSGDLQTTTVTVEDNPTEGKSKVTITANTPVKYTKLDGSAVYKLADGKFYNAPTGGNEVPFTEVQVALINPEGNVTAPTRLTNIAAGEVSETSTDAINGSQLYSAVNVLGTQVSNTYFHTNTAQADQGQGDLTTNKGLVTDKAGALGDYSITAGINARAYGENNIALGRNSRAGGGYDELQSYSNSVAIGFNVNAGNISSVAIGDSAYTGTEAKGSVAIGYLAGTGRYSTDGISIGTKAYSKHFYNIALGVKADVDGEGSIAIGANNETKLSHGLVLGNRSIVRSVKGIAVGHSNEIIATATDTQILGSGVRATQANSVILGSGSQDRAATSEILAKVGGIIYDNFAGKGSVENGIVSVGYGGKERQIINVAAGQISETSTDAINGSQLYAVANTLGGQIANTYFHVRKGFAALTGDVAENKGLITDTAGATGFNTLAAGISANAKGDLSMAVGYEASTGEDALESLAFGVGAKAQNKSTTAIGARSEAIGTYSLAIGGSSQTGVTPTVTKAEGNSSIALGYGSTTASGANWSQAIGDLASVGQNATYSMALGTKADIEDDASYSTAIGGYAMSSVIGGTAIGYGATVYSEGGIALGSESHATRDKESIGYDVLQSEDSTQDNAIWKATGSAVSVGRSGKTNASGQALPDITRQITNVAAGSSDTDAVNLAQLKAAGLKFAGNTDNMTIDKKLGKTLTIKGGLDNAAEATDKNTRVDVENGNMIVKMAKTLTDLTSATFGSGDNIVKVDGTGLQFVDSTGSKITNTPSITKDGIDAGNKQINNVASAGDINNVANKNNAVNVSDLKAAIGSIDLTGTGTFGLTDDNTDEVTKNLNNTLALKGDGNIKTKVNANNDGIDFALANVLNVGTTAPVKIDGDKGVIGGLTNRTWDPANPAVVKGQAATEDQLKVVSDKAKDAQSAVNTLSNNPLTFAGDSGSGVSRKLGEKLTIKGGETEASKLADGNNVGVVADSTSNSLTVKLAKDIDLSAAGSVKTGNSLLDNEGLTVSDKQGNATIVGKEGVAVADEDGNTAIYTSEGSGIADKDGNQNVSTAQNTILEDIQGNSATISATGFSVTDGTYTSRLTATSLTIAGKNPVLIDGSAGTIGGLSNTTFDPNKTYTGGQAATQEQLKAVYSFVKNAQDSVDKPLTFAADSGDNVSRKLGDTLNIKGGATELTSNNIGVVAVGNTLTVKLAKDVDLSKDGSVTVGNTKMGDGKIVGLSNKTLGDRNFAQSGRAATEEQLNEIQENLTSLLGGNATNTNGNVRMTNIGDTGKNNIHDAIKSVKDSINTATAAAKTAVKAGNNITVTSIVGVNGQDIYTVATNSEVEFDKITVGNVVVGSSGISAGGNKVTNVAAGLISEKSTDAVNGSQLYVLSTAIKNGTAGLVQQSQNEKNIKDGVNNNPITVGVSTGGTEVSFTNSQGNERRLTGVAAGINSTDAVNVGQLMNVERGLNKRIDSVQKEARSGASNALAVASMPQAYEPGQRIIAAGTGYYKDSASIAVGVSQISDNGKVIFKFNGSASQRGDVGVGAGVGFVW